MFQEQIKEYAKKNGIDFDVVERQKLVFVFIPAIPAGVNQKIYFPFDADLKNSIITGIRGYFGTNAGALSGMPLTNYLDGLPIAASNLLLQFGVNLVDAHQNFILENYPLYDLLSTAFINNENMVKTLIRFVPEKSYISYYDVGNSYSPGYIPLMFSYHLVK